MKPKWGRKDEGRGECWGGAGRRKGAGAGDCQGQPRRAPLCTRSVPAPLVKRSAPSSGSRHAPSPGEPQEGGADAARVGGTARPCHWCPRQPRGRGPAGETQAGEAARGPLSRGEEHRHPPRSREASGARGPGWCAQDATGTQAVAPPGVRPEPVAAAPDAGHPWWGGGVRGWLSTGNAEYVARARFSPLPFPHPQEITNH